MIFRDNIQKTEILLDHNIIFHAFLINFITFCMFTFPLLIEIGIYCIHMGIDIKQTCCMIYLLQMWFFVILSKRQRFYCVRHEHFSWQWWRCQWPGGCCIGIFAVQRFLEILTRKMFCHHLTPEGLIFSENVKYSGGS